MATLGSLVLEFKADIGRLQADMNRAVGVVDKGSANIKRAAGIARTALIGIGAGISVAGLTSFVKSGINASDAIGKMAQKTGVATEEFSKLAYAAKINDVEVESFSRALLKLGTNADTAAAGNKTLSAAFQELQTDVTDSAGRVRDADKIFLDVADTFAKMEDGPRRNALALKVFGKSYAELIPLLAQGRAGIAETAAEAERFGLVVSDEAAKAADEFNDNLDRLGAASKGLAIEVGNALVPALNDVVDAFIRGREQGGLFDATLNALRATAELALGDPLTNQIEDTISKIDDLKGRLKDLKGETFFGKLDRAGDAIAGRDQTFNIRATEAAISALNKKLADQKQLQADLAKPDKPSPALTALNPPRTPPPDTAGESTAKAAERARLAAIKAEADYIRQLRETIATETDASAAAKARFDILSGEASGFSELGKARIVALAQEIDLLKESAEVQEELQRIAHDREEQAINDAEALADKRIAVIESLRTPLEQYNEEVRKLSLLKLDDETFQRGLARAREELDGVAESARSANDAVGALGLTFSSALEDAIVNGAEFKDLLGGIEKDLLRLGTRKLITEPLFGNNSGDSGIVGDLIGKAFEGGDIFSGLSKAFGSFFGGFKAEGGAVDTGKFYVVGERGPELLVPGSSGTIVNNIQTKQLLSSVSTDRAGRAAAAKVLEPQNFGGGLADGGPVAVGKFYRVGERGPELLVAGGSGTIINHALSKQIFGGARANGGSVEAGKFYRVGELGPELLLANNSSNTNVSNNTRGPVSVVINYASPPRNAQERSSAMQVAAMAGTQVRKALERNT